MSYSFRCRTCGEIHEGMPALSADAPLYYYAIPPDERAMRCELTTDTCIIDEQFYFVRGNIWIPVAGLDEKFCWGVWTSISQENFKLLMKHWEDPERTNIGPFFGWISADLKVYPDTQNLKALVLLQAIPMRPHFELEQTVHPLAIEQREGISMERLAEIYEAYLH